MTVTRRIRLQTQGNCHVLDITAEAQQELKATGLKEGVVTLFVTGSTAGITVIENERGLVRDFQRLWEKLIPQNSSYEHNLIDDNAHSHLRASLLGPSLSVPFSGGSLILGTWQRIVMVDFDDRPRSREVVLQIVGE